MSRNLPPDIHSLPKSSFDHRLVAFEIDEEGTKAYDLDPFLCPCPGANTRTLHQYRDSRSRNFPGSQQPDETASTGCCRNLSAKDMGGQSMSGRRVQR